MKALEKPLGTISQEAAACRKAFAKSKSKIGDPVWHCHHADGIELLRGEPEERIRYILNFKSFEQQALRLRLFRPITTADMRSAPKHIRALFAEYRKKRGVARLDAKKKLENALDEAKVATMHRKLCGCPWRFLEVDIFGK